MKMEENNLQEFDSLTKTHELFGLPKPQHPLISLINSDASDAMVSRPAGSHVLKFYKISYKTRLSGKIKYGQGYYDFDGGGLLFASPNQIIGTNEQNIGERECSLFTLLIHPDFLLSYPLAKKIKQYGFFSYSLNETLHLSDEEKEIILSVFKIIEHELNSRIDEFSQDVVIAQIELLLSYANRFYKRQFITRKAANNELLQQLEELLDTYLNNENTLKEGIPTVQYLSDHLNISPSYLSDMLRSLTGQNAQQHIHNKLIEKAKEKLSITNLSVSEIAYELGFEHPQSFSRFFKTKTTYSPLEFRQKFN
ncbi:AraC family transcriptional regulator [Flavobacteriaceae bacterium CRH]|nr:AraC family transcriptional regulator [Flavobacteriaceae bacterium CRH]